MENLTHTTMTTGVSCCDPYATILSSHEVDDESQKKSKRKIHEIEKKHKSRPDSGDFEQEMGFNKPNPTIEGEKLLGVCVMKTGKFGAEIQHPVNKKWVWLGTFDTAEAASTAYLAQESKFAEVNLTHNQQVESIATENSTPLSALSRPNSDKPNPGVRLTQTGKYRASIKDPFRDKRVWLGTFATAEEASEVYLAKSAEFEAKKLKVEKARSEAKELRAKQGINRVASGKSPFLDSLSLVGGKDDTSGLTSFQECARTKISGVEIVAPENSPFQDSVSSVLDCFNPNPMNAGVRLRRSGKFGASIRDPFKKKKVWLGTFMTAEEASSAYLAKSAEFEAKNLKLKKDQEFRIKQKIDRMASDNWTFQDSVSLLPGNDTSDLTMSQEGAKMRISMVELVAPENSPFQDLAPLVLNGDDPNPKAAGKKIGRVRMTKNGQFSAAIRDPFKKKEVGLGSFATAEEASRACLAKNAEFEAKKLRIEEARSVAKELRAKQRMDQVASDKSTFEESVSLVCGKDDTTDLAYFQEGAKTKISGVELVAAENSPFQDLAPSVLNSDNPSPMTAGKKIGRVRMTKNGQFSAAIRDPFKKKEVGLGSFATAEEASRACFAKNAEFDAKKLRIEEARSVAKELRAKQRMDQVASDKSTFEESVSLVCGKDDTTDLNSFPKGGKTKISGVELAAPENSPFQDLVPSVSPMTAGKKILSVPMKKDGQFSATIRAPFKKKDVGFGSFATAEEASRACLGKNAEFEAKKLIVKKARSEVEELGAKHRMDLAASDKSTFQESLSLVNGKDDNTDLTSFQEGARTSISGVELVAPENSPLHDLVPSVLNCDNPNPLTTGMKIVMVRMAKNGQFSATTRDPFKKKDVGLGSFATAEEASMVCIKKNAEFEAKKLGVEKAQSEVKELRAKQRMDQVVSDKSTFQEPVSFVPGNDTSVLTLIQEGSPSDLTSIQEDGRRRSSGIMSRNSGRFGWRNTFFKRRVWPNMLASAEEVSKAYLGKRAQFLAKKLISKRRIDPVASDKSQDPVSPVLVRSTLSGVLGRSWGIRKRRGWRSTLATDVEASRAYPAKQTQFVAKKLRPKRRIDRFASEKSSAPHSVSSVPEIKTLDRSNGTCVAESFQENKVSVNQEAAGFGFFNGVQVVDKNGFLVGEYRMLDDFSICWEGK